MRRCPMQIERITHNPAVMGGKPCIRGLRVTVGTILGLLASGAAPDRTFESSPDLGPADLYETLAYAAWRLGERNEVIERTSPLGPITATEWLVLNATADDA